MTTFAIILAICGHAFMTTNWDKSNGNDVCGILLAMMCFGGSIFLAALSLPHSPV